MKLLPLSVKLPMFGKTLAISPSGTPNQRAIAPAYWSIAVLGSSLPWPTWSSLSTEMRGAVKGGRFYGTAPPTTK